MLRLTAVLAAGTILAGCATRSEPVVEPVAPPVVEPVAPVAPEAAPTPEIGTFGFDVAGMDKSVLPGNKL